MEFFKDLGNKISHTSQEAIKKTKELADTTKLNGEINSEEKKINNYYQVIGKKYFEKYKDAPEEEFAELVDEIKSAFENIEEAKVEIKRLKGKRACPNCGAEQPLETPFCCMCGTKMPEIEKEQEADSEEAVEEEQVVESEEVKKEE